jgi:hypothetical protein
MHKNQLAAYVERLADADKLMMWSLKSKRRLLVRILPLHRIVNLLANTSRLNAVRCSVGNNALPATTVRSQHPDAKLANLRVAVASVGTVLASTGLEDLRLSLSDGLGSWGSEGKAKDGSDGNSGETHDD